MAKFRSLTTADWTAAWRNLVVEADAADRRALLVLLDGLLRWDPIERWAGARILQRLHARLEADGCAWRNPAGEGVLPCFATMSCASAHV